MFMHGELALLGAGTFGVVTGTVAYFLRRPRAVKDRVVSYYRRRMG